MESNSHLPIVALSSAILVTALLCMSAVAIMTDGSDTYSGTSDSMFYSSFGDLQDLPTADVDGLHYTLSPDDTQAIIMGFSEGSFTKDLVIPSGITVDGTDYSVLGIYSSAFSGSDVETLTVPDGIVGIADYAFYECTKLKSVSIGKDVSYLDAAFDVVSLNYHDHTCEAALETFTVSEDNTTYRTIDNVLYTKDLTKLRMCVPMKTGSFTIPNTVKEIGSSAFRGSHLSSITVPESVKYVNTGSFSWCMELKELTIPSSVGFIGGTFASLALGWCPELEYLTVATPILDNSAITSLMSLRYMHITDDTDQLTKSCVRNDEDAPYQLISLVIGDIGSVEEGDPFANFLFYDSETSEEPLEQSAETLSGSAWWSSGKYDDDGYLRMYRAYTLTLDADGGRCPIGAIASGKDGKVSEIPAAESDGKRFDGWYDDKGVKITPDHVFTADTVLHAHYSDDDKEARSVLIVGIASVIFVVIFVGFCLLSRRG